MAIPSIFAIFLRLPVGTAASRLGKKRIILFALAVQSLSFILLGFLFDLNSLFAVRILQGIAVSLFPPIITAAIYDLAIPANRGKMFGIFFTSIGLAMISGPLVSSILLQFLNFNTFFMVLSVFPALGFCVYLIGSSDSSQSSVERYGGGVKSVWRVLKNRNVLALCSCRALFAITASMFATVFSIYAENVLLITASLVSALFMIRGIFNTIFRLPSGKISDRIGRKKPIILSYILLVGVFYLFSEIGSFIAFVLIMALYGFAWGLRVAPETALVSDLVDNEDVNVGIALLQTMFPIGSTIGSILAGWLALTVPIQTIFKLSSLIIIPAIVIISSIKEA
jgi:predicted MFS family arabinose efflux permease